MTRPCIAAVVCFATLIAWHSRASAQKPPQEEVGAAAPGESGAPSPATPNKTEPNKGAPDKAEPSSMSPSNTPPNNAAPSPAALTDQAVDALRLLAKDGDLEVRTSALLALADLQDGRAMREALADAQLPAEVRAALVDHLLESLGGALILLRLVEADPLAADAKAAVLAGIAAHPDSLSRSLFEGIIPADERSKKPAAAASAEDILNLKPDAERGERIFSQSSAAQCKTCHAMRGVGGDLGPDLSVIGHKLDRAALLEAIHAPSKSVAPGFVPYVLETTTGRFHAGYLVAKSDKEVVLKDIQGHVVRVPAAEVAAITAMPRSLMPDFKPSDAAAQDMADLLAYSTTLRNNEQPVTTFRTLGPLDASHMKLDKALEPEKSWELIAAPLLEADYKGVDGAELRWELAPTSNALGFPAIDTAKYDAGRKLRSTDVAHYFFVVAESPAAQTVSLLLGASGGCKLWVNGQLTHFHDDQRALAYGADKFTSRFKAGRNAILVKVQNGSSPGGVTLALRGQEPLELKTE